MEADLDRLDRVRQAMRASGLDALLCCLPHDVLMLTGYAPIQGASFALFPLDGDPTLLVPEWEESMARQGWVADVRGYSSSSLHRLGTVSEAVGPLLSQLAREKGMLGRAIGYEHDYGAVPASSTQFAVATAGTVQLYQEAFGDAEWRPADREIEELEAVLTEREVDMVRLANLVAAQGMLAARQAAAQGEQLRALSAQSWENASKIDAAKKAAEHGIALNPAVSNPTLPNRTRVAMAGNAVVNQTLSRQNETRFTQMARNDIGLLEHGAMDAKAFEAARNRLSGPYDVIKGVEQLAPDEKAIEGIRSIKVPDIIGEKTAAQNVRAVIEDAVDHVKAGMSGAKTLDQIRSLRQAATRTYNSEKAGHPIPPADIAVADAQMAVATRLEDLIESNISDPQALANFRAARAGMAKTYDYERATDFNTGRIDPTTIAKIAEERKHQGRPMSQVFQDIGEIAANYPEVSKIGVVPASAWRSHLVRSGVPGTVGLGVGMLTGNPALGIIAGAGLGELSAAAMGRRIASQGFQAKNALRPDYRLNFEQPATAAAAPVTPNLPVPYDFRNAMLTPEQIPNWTFGRATPEPDVRVGIPPGPPQLPPPSAEGTMGWVQGRRAHEYRTERTAAEARDAEQAAREAAARQPTRGGQVYTLDELTGRLRSASEGIKGATPETITSTGHALEAATRKLSAGQSFALSAEEKIAWDRAKVDLATIDPAFKTLDQKELASRMMDRQWVADAVTKARDKAAAFDEIARRATVAKDIKAATDARERLMDLADTLDERLRVAPRPKIGQGPKTREAVRNQLVGRNRNALAE